MDPPAPLPTKDALIARLQELAQAMGRRCVGLDAFERATGIPRYDVMRVFGSFGALCRAAGLISTGRRRLDDDMLMRALRDAFLKAGGIVGRDQARRLGAYSDRAYAQRWGSWRGVLAAFRAWAAIHDPGFPHLGAIPKFGPGPPPVRRSPRGPRYGAPLTTSPLLHAPTNELGVLVLFGALATSLGFTIERVGAGFPDCDAKQRVGDGWHSVRIEFEYQSRNFHEHKHDPEGCDLIVCWEHNWPAAPLEVLELKTELAWQMLERCEGALPRHNPDVGHHAPCYDGGHAEPG